MVYGRSNSCTGTVNVFGLTYFCSSYAEPLGQTCQTQFGSAGSRCSVLKWAGSVKECQLQIFSFVFQYYVLFSSVAHPGFGKGVKGTTGDLGA